MTETPLLTILNVSCLATTEDRAVVDNEIKAMLNDQIRSVTRFTACLVTVAWQDDATTQIFIHDGSTNLFSEARADAVEKSKSPNNEHMTFTGGWHDTLAYFCASVVGSWLSAQDEPQLAERSSHDFSVALDSLIINHVLAAYPEPPNHLIKIVVVADQEWLESPDEFPPVIVSSA